MFVDYLTVMMVAVVAGAVLTVAYGLMFLEAPLADQKPWGWAFAVVGLLLAVTGLHLVLTWPLPGAYNIVMGEPALYFGLVLLGTAFAIRAGESLMPLAVLAFFGGPSKYLLEHRHVGPRPLTQPSALGLRLRGYRLGCSTFTFGRT
jgi:putative membrane protein